MSITFLQGQIDRMITRLLPAILHERQAKALATIIFLQALCAIFFIGDVAVDLFQGDHLDDTHFALEMFAAVVMTAGVVYLIRELRDLLNHMAAMQLGIRAARGEMTTLIDTFFDQWKLTPSEREVALLILKGINNESIARMRGTAPGTVRAQCTQIYAKAEVDGRAQLLSIFMEELIHAREA